MKRDRNCMVHWWFYPERYVVHQHTVRACTHTHTHTTHTQIVWCIGGSIRRGMWYISKSMHVCAHSHTQAQLYGAVVVLSREVCGTSACSVHAHTHTHTHTNVCIHSQTHCHQLLLINGLLRWVVTARGMLCILAYCIIMPWAVHMQIICARIHTHTSCTHQLSLWFVYITC